MFRVLISKLSELRGTAERTFRLRNQIVFGRFPPRDMTLNLLLEFTGHHLYSAYRVCWPFGFPLIRLFALDQVGFRTLLVCLCIRADRPPTPRGLRIQWYNGWGMKIQEMHHAELRLSPTSLPKSHDYRTGKTTEFCHVTLNRSSRPSSLSSTALPICYNRTLASPAFGSPRCVPRTTSSRIPLCSPP